MCKTIIYNIFQNYHFGRMSSAKSSNQKENEFSCVSGIVCYIYISFIYLFQMCIEPGTSRLITVGWNYFWQESEVEVFKLQEKVPVLKLIMRLFTLAPSDESKAKRGNTWFLWNGFSTYHLKYIVHLRLTLNVSKIRV